MAYVLDLTQIQQPTLDLTLLDGVKVRVTIPGTDLVREIQAAEPSMTSLLAAGDKDSVDAAYELLARVLSCNLEGIKFTGADLMGEHRVNLYGIIAIYKAYGDFINGIEKN